MRVTSLAILLGLWAGTASADKADSLFKQGKKLLADKKYATACPLFEQVDKLDPGIGAKLNAARCFEQWGRLAVAYRWYGDAYQMAVATKDDRAAKIKEHLDEVDGNVPRVRVSLPEGADPTVVTRLTFDGELMAMSSIGVDLRVDPGPHVIEYTVDGQTKKKMAPVERGGSSAVMLEVARGASKPVEPRTPVATQPAKPTATSAVKPDKPAPAPVTTPTPPGRTQRIIGISVASGGLLTMGIAGAVTLRARGKYNDAIDDHCMGSSTMCDPTGITRTRDARSRANVATVVTVIGAAALVTGVVLYVIAPRKRASGEHALYLRPELGGRAGTLVFGGQF